MRFLPLFLSAAAAGTLVHLDYASYQGRALSDGTTHWLGMRYASPPLGPLRFKAPVDPASDHPLRSVDASRFGPICLARRQGDWTYVPNERFSVAEDCLFVNVFSPGGRGRGRGLPVMFFVQGGAFESNSNANFNGEFEDSFFFLACWEGGKAGEGV